jgi:hypothetical protein
MSHSAIMVFTEHSLKRLLADGGSQAWVLDRGRARRCEYVVCAQNTHSPWGDAAEPHGTAFLVGRISALVPAPDKDPHKGLDKKERWMIRISEYARIDIPNAWPGLRNPVRYTTLEELRINLDTLNFQPVPRVPEERIDPPTPPSPPSAGVVRPLTIAEAKQGLAAQFGVRIDDIQITIQG